MDDEQFNFKKNKMQGYQFGNDDQDASWETLVRSLWKEYTVDILGWNEENANLRIHDEITGEKYNKLLDYLESQGWIFENKNVLEVGCGTGGLTSQISRRSAKIVGLEPGPLFAKAAYLRLKSQRPDVSSHVLSGDGQKLPFKNETFDYIFCLQVLEHVPNPHDVIKEIARVLKVDGTAYLAFENYLSFYEPHYRLRWFPLLPKILGGFYLSLRRRNPFFLYQHIYYSIGIDIVMNCEKAGLIPEQWENIANKTHNPNLINNKCFRNLTKVAKKFLPDEVIKNIVICFFEISRLLTVTYSFNVHKRFRHNG